MPEALIKDILAYIGGFVLVLTFIRLLFEVIPRLNKLRELFVTALHRRVHHRSLEKRAIASNIENVVNDSVSLMSGELPADWAPRARIEWVDEGSLDAEKLEDGELILRIKPIEDQDINLMNGIFHYFTKALFPGIKRVIPSAPRKAAVLELSRRTINISHPYALAEFDKRYMESAIASDEEIPYYLGHYRALDERGFFTGVYIREVADLAEAVRFTAERQRIGEELRELLTHIVRFVESYADSIPEELWYRKTDNSCYGLLLVARPYSRKEEIYVRRSNERIARGIDRLYVLGANQERGFVRKVIAAIARDTNYLLKERFDLYRDYRGEGGGICAVFELPD